MNNHEALKQHIQLTNSEIEQYFVWINGLPDELKEEGIELRFEFLPGFYWQVSAHCGSKKVVLRDWL